MIGAFSPRPFTGEPCRSAAFVQAFCPAAGLAGPNPAILDPEHRALVIDPALDARYASRCRAESERPKFG